jgi:malate dehydrogenase (oxaloacetate-decarboxylating)(NADP+)
LHKRLQRRGALYHDCVRMVTNDRNIYAASLLCAREVDAMVTGATRAQVTALSNSKQIDAKRLHFDSSQGSRIIGSWCFE